ncbi:gas vesicle protein, partial [Nocardioides sp. DS6]
GIELLTIDARIVIASVDTYLRFAEATNRLDLDEHGGRDLTDLAHDLQEKGAEAVSKRAVGGVIESAAEKIQAVREKVEDVVAGGDDDD